MTEQGTQLPFKERLPLLDFLRILICGIVLLFHATIHNFWSIPKDTFLYKTLATGAIYMDAFFILSGFLLFYLHGEKFNEFVGAKIKNFYLKRLIRIYPAYIIYTVIIMFHDKFFNWAIIPAEILGIQSFFPPLFKYAGNGGTWFISCLIFSYLLFPFLAKVVHVTRKNILVMFLLYAMTVYISMVAAVFKIGWMPVYINPIYRMCEFMIGMYVAKLFLQSKKHKNLYYVISLCISVALLIILVPILYKNNYVNHTDFKENFIYYNFLTIPIFAVVILCLARIHGKFCDWLSRSKILSFFVGLTFPFYLYQGLSQRLAKDLHAWLHTYVPTCTLLQVLIITNFVFAIVAYFVVDKMLTHFLIKKNKKEKPC